MDSDSEFPKSSSSEAMFFSPRLLQRKTPMGRLWMAGTVGRKLSPRVLAKLNISALSELITNQPTAIRIPAILLKGLVSIFAMKVDIVLKDAESVWVTMAEHDPGPRVSNGINMARNRALARYEAVTLPQGVLVSQLNVVNHHANKLLFAKPPASSTWTFTMDDIPSSFISVDITDDMHHQAQKANITLDDDRSRMAQITDYVVEPDRIEISQETADELIHKVEAPFLPTCPGAREPPEPQVQPVTEVNPDTRIYLASSSVPVAAHHHGYFIAEEIMNEPKQDPPAVASNVIIDDQRLIIPAEVYKGWLDKGHVGYCKGEANYVCQTKVLQRSDNAKKKRSKQLGKTPASVRI